MEGGVFQWNSFCFLEFHDFQRNIFYANFYSLQLQKEKNGLKRSENKNLFGRIVY